MINKAGYQIKEKCNECGAWLRRTTLAERIYCPVCNEYKKENECEKDVKELSTRIAISTHGISHAINKGYYECMRAVGRIERSRWRYGVVTCKNCISILNTRYFGNHNTARKNK